jgi:hypothetical protein
LGEKPSSYFSKLENRNYTNKTMSELKTEDGTTVTEQKEILNMQKNFYENLYKEKSVEVDDCTLFDKLQSSDIPLLSETAKK